MMAIAFFFRWLPSLLIFPLSSTLGIEWIGGIAHSAIAASPANHTTSPILLAQSSPEEAPETSESPQEEPTDTSESPTASKSRFTCDMFEGKHTVMYHPESQPESSYAWAVPSALGGGWTPQRRCEEISRRLESYRPDGLLELRTSVENNYDIICVTTENIPDCRIVLTVPPGQDPELTRDLVFENLTQADRGRETEPVNTIVPENGVEDVLEDVLDPGEQEPATGRINLKPFLDPADGGTGTRLTDGNSSENNPQLDPEQFR